MRQLSTVTSIRAKPSLSSDRVEFARATRRCRYLVEFSFRYSTRGETDSGHRDEPFDQLGLVIHQLLAKRPQFV